MSPTQTLLVATDLSARSDRPMERALLLRDQLDASLLVLHVPPGEARLDADEEQRLRNAIRQEFGLAKDDAEIILDYGSVPTIVAEVARKRHCKLVVTGVARLNSPRDYILGTAVDYLVRRSPAPVLVVKRRARKPYERLLVATDFSAFSLEALRTAAELFPQSKLRLIHAYHAPYEALLSPGSTAEFIQKECEEDMERLVQLLPHHLQDRLETAVEDGHLPAVVAKNVKGWSADLLVVGSHGRSGFAHATIGSQAADLLESEPCDVLVVRGSAE